MNSTISKEEVARVFAIYLGYECQTSDGIKALRSLPYLFGELHAEFGDSMAYELEKCKLLLHPLSAITDEELYELFKLSIGVVDDAGEVIRYSSSSISITKGFRQYIFAVSYDDESDVRLNGISISLRYMQLESQLSVSSCGISEGTCSTNEWHEQRVLNASLIVLKLLEWKFDIVGAISAGLAIDSTTL